MKTNKNKLFFTGFAFIIAFVVWTTLIQVVDVQSIGVNNTNVGLATINRWFHSLTGVNMTLYTVTDWLGLIPIFVCMLFGFMGLVQWIKRKSLLKVDFSVIISGIYYVIVILCYLIFEEITINYRPILINGVMEASYPSSTTLLVLCVMPTLVFLTNRMLKSNKIKSAISVITFLFSSFMVMGRLISGVHWLTDIMGSVFLSMGLFCIYKSIIIMKENEGDFYGIW